MKAIAKTKPQASSIQSKFAATRKEMAATLVERDEEIDLALTALIAQQHLLMVGPPGTAKSLVVETVRAWIDQAKSLTIHCCKDSTRNVCFGPIKLSGLKQDRTERALEGGAADSHILILEEVFKAGPAVLDMFLLVMNERIYKEGLVQAKTPLRLLLGVSNEWSPEGCETALAAFFDRFLIRKAVAPIRSQAGIRKLVALPINNNGKPNARSHVPQLSTQITLTEIDQAHQDAMTIPFSQEAANAFYEIHKELGREGIVPGDRRLKLSVNAAQAFAYLNGAKEVNPEHLEVLAHILWVDPQEQPQKAAKVVAKIANPVGMAINDCLIQADDVIAKAPPTEAVPKLQAIQKELQKMRADPRRERALAYVSDSIKEAYNAVIGIGNKEEN